MVRPCMAEEVFRDILFAKTQQNATNLIGQGFTLEMDNDPKHIEKEKRDFLKVRVEYSAMAESVI